MNPSDADPNLLGRLVDEWQERLRRGERPDLDDYVGRYPALADEIRELFPGIVALEDLKGDVLDQTVAPAATVTETRRLERLGDYRILREVGRGGMGVVYEAEQESLGRRVALKVLPAGALLDPRQQKRFQREARAAARLHHTNIVPVYGVGEHEGIHYYVMQYIQGLGLDRVLAELKRLRPTGLSPAVAATVTRPDGAAPAPDLSAADVAKSLVTGRFVPAAPGPGSSQEADGERGTPTAPLAVAPPGPPPTDPAAPPPAPNTLSESGRDYWRRVARIGIQVAEALEYAASQGVLHRDIKPSNLLLDTQGNVWVTDFGLAKAVADADDLTHTGDIVGTLRYMAPERFEGHSDVRGDVYSLGLTLYELLVRQPAFPETERNRLIHRVTHEAPAPPRRLNPVVPRDLETIVLKATARDPAHRYATPGELAADLKRFVEDRPIRARRVSVPERLWRWCRRNPAVAGLTAGVVALLAVLAVASTLAAFHFEKLAQQERAARAEAEGAHQSEADQRRRADAARREAEANFVKARRAVDDYFTKVSESQLLTVPGLQPLRYDLLQSARGFYEEFARERTNDPTLAAELAAAQLRLGLIDTDLGFEAGARRALDGAIAAYEAAARATPDDLRSKEGLGDAWNAVGQLYWEKNFEESRKAYEHSAQVREELLRAEPANARYQRDLAKAYNGLGVMQQSTGQGTEALRSYRRCLDLRLELAQERPDDPTLQHAVSESLHNIAVLLPAGRAEEKLALLRRANEYNRAACARLPHVMEYAVDLGTNYQAIAGTAWQLSRNPEALAANQEGIDHLRRVAKDNPAVPGVHTRLILALRWRAAVLRTVGRAAEAQAARRQAQEVLDQLPREGPDNLFLLACVRAQGAALLGQDREAPSAEEQAEQRREADQAVAELRQAVAAGFRDVQRLRLVRELASLQSRPDFQELLAGLEKALPANTPPAAAGSAPPGGPREPAAEAVRQAQLRTDLASAQYAIGLVQIERGQADEAAKTLAQALAVREALARDHPDQPQFQADLAELHLALGGLHWKAGRLAEADREWQDGLKRLEAVVAAHPDDARLADRLADGHAQLFQTYAKDGLWTEAAAHLGRAVELDPTNHWKWYRLAPLLLRAGDTEGYERHCQAMLARFGTTDQLELAERTAKACLILPASGPVLEQATRLAEQAASDKQHWVWLWALATKGLADYRNGRFAEAVQAVRQPLAKPVSWNLEIPARYVLAMAEKALDHPEKARQALAEADKAYGRTARSEDSLSPLALHDWFMCGLLRREAHERVTGKALPDNPREHLRRGQVYARLGWTEKAEAEFEAFVAGRAEEPRPWVLRSRVFAELGQRQRAEADLARAQALLDQVPAAREDASLWRDLALTWKALQKPHETVAALRHALALQRRALEAGPVREAGGQLLRDIYAKLTAELRAAGQTAEAEALVAELRDLCDARGINPVQTFAGHTHDWVETVAVLPDGRRALSGGYDDTVRLWDLATGQELRTFHHDGPVRCVTLTPDGRRFLSGSHDKLMRLWDVETGREVRRFAGHTGGVMAVALVPGGRQVVSGGSDGTLRLWDLETGRELRQFTGHTQGVLGLAVTPDGRKVLSSSSDRTVRVWSLADGVEVMRFGDHLQRVWALALSPDGRQVVSGDGSGLLIWWDLETGEELGRSRGDGQWGEFRGLHFLADGRRVLASTYGGWLFLLDAATGEELWRLPSPAAHAQLALHPDGRHVLTADGDKTARLWTVPPLQPADQR